MQLPRRKKTLKHIPKLFYSVIKIITCLAGNGDNISNKVNIFLI